MCVVAQMWQERVLDNENRAAQLGNTVQLLQVENADLKLQLLDVRSQLEKVRPHTFALPCHPPPIDRALTPQIRIWHGLLRCVGR